MAPVLGMAAGAAAGQVLGMINDERQVRVQQRLQNQQIRGAKELGAYNHELAMQTWKDTNYSAQRAQMEKAGINLGLMYGGSGAGGTTSGGAVSMPTGGQAPTGGGEIGMGMMQMALIKAQKENIEADTKVKLRDAQTDTPGKTEADIKATLADADNKRLQGIGLTLDNRLKEIETQLQGETLKDRVKMINQAAQKAESEARTSLVQAKVSEFTQAQVIKQINMRTDRFEVALS